MAETTSKTGSGSGRPKKKKKTGSRTTPAQAAQKAARKSSGTGKGGLITAIVVAAVLTVLAVLAGGGYLWHQRALNARIAGDEQDAKQAGEQRDRINAMEKRLDAFLANQTNLGGRVGQLRERLDNAEKTRETGEGIREENREKIRGLSDSIAALRSESGRNAEHRGLEEVERLLVIANQRLQLTADVGLAGKALKLAEDGLRRLSHSASGLALGPVREMLADEIASLDAVVPVDVAGTLNALSALARGVEDLPLAGDVKTAGNHSAAATAASPPAEQTGGASSLWAAGQSFLADLGALVQIETDGKPQTPILSVELRWMIFEKTGLILESCQLAFLREHGEAYAARMEAAKNWVTKNFDTDSAEVVAWLERWAALAAEPVSPQTGAGAGLPDISASLRALREVMRAGN